jgi:cell shape-determining protein MreD
MLHSLMIPAGWLSAIYAAVAVQTAFSDARLPVFTAAVAAWAVVTGPAARGIVWAALTGLACDAAGHDRLGPHLLCYATVAAVAAMLMPAVVRPNAWLAVPLAGMLAAADRCGDELLRSLHRPYAALLYSILADGATTALLVFALLSLASVLQRLLQPAARTAALRLSNRWTMLTE